jgi:hypothetical protein
MPEQNSHLTIEEYDIRNRNPACDLHGYILPYYMIDPRIRDASKFIKLN